jgi:hypothetical protein
MPHIASSAVKTVARMLSSDCKSVAQLPDVVLGAREGDGKEGVGWHTDELLICRSRHQV